MRILFTFVGGLGHFEPLVPFARAAASAGHEVAFGCALAMAAHVEAAGFRAFRIGSQTRAAPRRLPLRPLDSDNEDRDLRERFARRAARYRAPRIVTLCEQWRPEVLVCDETDFGSMIAGEAQGVPFATVSIMAAGSFVRAEVVAEPLDELRVDHGLKRDPKHEMPAQHLVLSPFPASFRDPEVPWPATAHAFRHTPPAADASEVWAPPSSDRPLIYFTLGTIFNIESGDLQARVIAGLRDLPIDLIATIGPHVDPAELDPQPSNVRIERFVPQAQLLPHCAAVVSHGGSGSVIGALAHGLPTAVIPLGADQPANAQRCVDLGVGLSLDAIGVTSESVSEAVTSLLEDASYRSRARELQSEIAALPGPAEAVPLLERLVSG